FLTCQPLDQPVRLFGPDLDVFISKSFVVDGGANRARHVLPPFQPVERRVRLQTDAAKLRIESTQTSRGAHKRTARAEPGHTVRYSSRGLLPDFVRGRAEMGLPVRRVAVLIWIVVAVGVFRYDFMHAADRSVCPLFTRR